MVSNFCLFYTCSRGLGFRYQTVLIFIQGVFGLGKNSAKTVFTSLPMQDTVLALTRWVSVYVGRPSVEIAQSLTDTRAKAIGFQRVQSCGDFLKKVTKTDEVKIDFYRTCL